MPADRQVSHHAARQRNKACTCAWVCACYGALTLQPAEEPAMPASHEKQPDQGRIVESLALECHMPVAEMAALYEHERADLAFGAHITKFLHIFAIRSVLEILRQRKLDTQPSTLAEPALFAA
jgi:hypothetical protein